MWPPSGSTKNTARARSRVMFAALLTLALLGAEGTKAPAPPRKPKILVREGDEDAKAFACMPQKNGDLKCIDLERFIVMYEDARTEAQSEAAAEERKSESL